MSIADNDLDALLGASLEEPVDMGFSARVMTEVADLRLAQAKREAILSLVAVALLVLIAALTPLGPAFGKVAEVLAGTPQLWFGAFLLLVSGVVYTRIRTA